MFESLQAQKPKRSIPKELYIGVAEQEELKPKFLSISCVPKSNPAFVFKFSASSGVLKSDFCSLGFVGKKWGRKQ
jgi:hypothetical protein